MAGDLQFQCQSCPYIYAIDRKVRQHAHSKVLHTGRAACMHCMPCLQAPETTYYMLQITTVVPLKKKEVDDVLGGDEAWENVASTNGAQHPRLLHHKLGLLCAVPIHA